MLEVGSIQRLVPVKPVWPKEPGWSCVVMGKMFAAGAGEGGVEVPAEAALGDAFGGLPSWVKMVASVWAVAGAWGLVARRRVACVRGKGPVLCRSLSRRAWQKRLMSCGGGEDAGVSGDSAHAAGGGVVDGAAEEVVEVGVGGWVGWIRRRGRWGRCWGCRAEVIQSVCRAGVVSDRASHDPSGV